jgi:hypothetical protein
MDTMTMLVQDPVLEVDKEVASRECCRGFEK